MGRAAKLSPAELAAAGRALLRLEERPGPLDTPCWVYSGYLNVRTGYGQIRAGARHLYVHRLMYELVVGAIPAGRQVHHRCEVAACANPEHLEALTRQQHYGRAHRRTVCAHGHPLTERNTASTIVMRHGANVGKRRCRICHNAQRRAVLA